MLRLDDASMTRSPARHLRPSLHGVPRPGIAQDRLNPGARIVKIAGGEQLTKGDRHAPSLDPGRRCRRHAFRPAGRGKVEAHPGQRPPHELRPLPVLACPDRAGVAQDRTVQEGRLQAGRAGEPAPDPHSQGMAGGSALADRGVSLDTLGAIRERAVFAALSGRPAGHTQAGDLGVRRAGLDGAPAAETQEAGRRLGRRGRNGRPAPTRSRATRRSAHGRCPARRRCIGSRTITPSSRRSP